MNQDNRDILDEILKVAIESSNQEKERSQILLTKSDYLMKYIAAMFVFVNAVCVFIMSNSNVSAWIVCIYYFLVGMSFLFSVCFTIKAQTLLKCVFFPTGQDIFSNMLLKYNEGNTLTSQDLRIDTIKYYSNYTKSLQVANDNRAKLIDKGYNAFFIGTIVITGGLFLIMVIIA